MTQSNPIELATRIESVIAGFDPNGHPSVEQLQAMGVTALAKALWAAKDTGDPFASTPAIIRGFHYREAETLLRELNVVDWSIIPCGVAESAGSYLVDSADGFDEIEDQIVCAGIGQDMSVYAKLGHHFGTQPVAP